MVEWLIVFVLSCRQTAVTLGDPEVHVHSHLSGPAK